MPVTKTRRMVTAGGLEWRSTSDGVTVEGHASTFNQPYDMGWYMETVAPGAFTRTLATNPDVRLLINHEGLPLGRTTSGTLDLSQDDSGLYMKSVLDPGDPDVQRIVPKMERGDLNEMSFAFGTVVDEWNSDLSARTLRELSLAGGDVSVVTYPANPNASIALRMQSVAAENPEVMREAYARLIEERNTGQVSPRTAAALASMLESMSVVDNEIGESLSLLNDLLDFRTAEPRTEGNAPTGIPARDLRLLIDMAKRH